MHTSVRAREVPPLSGIIVEIVDAFNLRSDARLPFDVALTRGINAVPGNSYRDRAIKAAYSTHACRAIHVRQNGARVSVPHVAHGPLDRSFSARSHAICRENWKSGGDQAREAPMPFRVLAFLLIAVVAQAADLRAIPPDARESLESGVSAAVSDFNAQEERRHQKPQVETSGPPEDPFLLRATYRKATREHEIIAIEPGAMPVVTVRVRATEFEKRAARVNDTDLRAEFEKARWRETPRGYMLDFRLRWTGMAWEQVGEPASFPVLGVIRDPDTMMKPLEERNYGGR
jgi:hypothetical protein